MAHAPHDCSPANAKFEILFFRVHSQNFYLSAKNRLDFDVHHKPELWTMINSFIMMFG